MESKQTSDKKAARNVEKQTTTIICEKIKELSLNRFKTEKVDHDKLKEKRMSIIKMI